MLTQSTKQQTQQKSSRSTPVLVRVGPQQWIINHEDEHADGGAIYSTHSNQPGTDAEAYEQNRLSDRFPRLFRRLSEMEDAAVRLLQTEEQLGHDKTPSTAPAVRSRRQRRRLRESFQVGIIIGLILGCLSLVMFHQVEPSTIQAVPSSSIVEAANSRQLTLPAITLEAVTAGTSLSRVQATAVQDNLKKHGLQSSLWQQKNGFDVVTRIGMTSNDISSYLARTKSAQPTSGARIVTVHIPAATVAAGRI